MRGQAGFFDVDERLKELSAKGDDLERLASVVNFELFRADLARAVVRSDGAKGGRPPFDHVFMWKVLILQASHSLSDERTEFLIKDRLSFMRFLGLGLAPGAGRQHDVDVPRGVDAGGDRRPAGDPGLVLGL